MQSSGHEDVESPEDLRGPLHHVCEPWFGVWGLRGLAYISLLAPAG